MSKYPKDDDLDTFERKVLKYLYNNVSVDNYDSTKGYLVINKIDEVLDA